MCGITGIAALNGSLPPSLAQLQQMCDTLYHRGPDQEGLRILDDVALGMRRLAIIDLSDGGQPIFNENRSIATVFNGEIYNFRELRSQLEGRGHCFSTQSDTEVIVHAYEEYGVDFPSYLNGMFAIALYDTVQKKLILVRDHLGVKPLYYAYDHRYIIWGSEIKAILASGWVQRELNLDALSEFLTWEYIPGRATLFKAVCKLQPGETLEIDLQTAEGQLRQFWDIPQTPEDDQLTTIEWQALVQHQLHKSVQRQMISDVPLGAFLSGGVDSSLMVASMRQAQTFSIGFEDQSYNELQWSQQVADHLGVTHFYEQIQPEVADLFSSLMHHLDDPIGDFSIFSTYLVSKLARQHVTVALGGDGGDELFGGYETYLADSNAKYYALIPPVVRRSVIERSLRSLRPTAQKKGLVNKAKRFVEGLSHPAALAHTRWRIFMGETLRQSLFTPSAFAEIQTPASSHILNLFDQAGDRQPLNRSLYVDVKSYLCDNILTKVDRMSMAVSLEARVPYLDPDLVELAFRMPAHLKVHHGQTKVLLKAISARHVPKNCVYRPKQGFSIPIKNWLNTQFRPLLEDYLNAQDIRQQGIFQPNTVEQLKAEHFSGIANHSHILWSLIVFQAWRRQWLRDL
jgi:asparagine synthase (glutamine-hydrolysing)